MCYAKGLRAVGKGRFNFTDRPFRLLENAPIMKATNHRPKGRRDLFMAIKVGINGFGRIGRVALRIMVERGSHRYQICGINLRNADLDYMVYQVKYDSVFRTFRDTVEHDDRHLIINGKKIRVYSESDASQIRWRFRFRWRWRGRGSS